MINIYSYFQAGRSSKGSDYFNNNDHVDETLQSVHSPVPLSPTNELADAPCYDHVMIMSMNRYKLLLYLPTDRSTLTQSKSSSDTFKVIDATALTRTSNSPQASVNLNNTQPYSTPRRPSWETVFTRDTKNYT